jgi:hypothetical protein
MTKAPKGWDVIEPSTRKRPARTGRAGSPPGKKRLMIKEKTESRIREIIETWSEPRITWEALTEVVNAEFQGDWSPQALMKHKSLKKAYDRVKDRLRELAAKGGQPRRRAEGDGTIEVMRKQLRAAREEIEKLRSTNQKLLDKFVRWKSNAYLKGWSVKDLDAKLDKPDRGRTDKDR